MTLTLREFHNGLRILTSIDRHELSDAGIVTTENGWLAFRQDPFRWFLRTSDSDADKLWQIIEARQTKVPA